MKRRKLPNRKVISLDLYREKIEPEERSEPRVFARGPEPEHIFPECTDPGMRFALRWHGGYAFQKWMVGPLTRVMLVKLLTKYPANISADYSAERLILAALKARWIRVVSVGILYCRTVHREGIAFVKLKLPNPRIRK